MIKRDSLARVNSKKLRRGLITFVLALSIYILASELIEHYLKPILYFEEWGVFIGRVEVLPTVRSLWNEFSFQLRTRIFQASIIVSLTRLAEGYLLGGGLGLILGLTAGWRRQVDYALDPWLNFFRFTPALALLPLYTIWFGAGDLSKILLIATGVMTVSWIGAYHGIIDVPRVYLHTARILGAGGPLLLRKIVVPAAFPHIFGALRVALASAWTLLVFSELMDPRIPSLGYLLTLGAMFLRTPLIIVSLAAIGLIVYLSDVAAMLLYHKATGWMKRTVEA